MSERIGDVVMAGTLAGPESAWPVSEAALSAALEKSGCPSQCLRVIREGGWVTIEPVEAKRSDRDFGQEAGVALGEAIRGLAQGRALAEEWGSTLRVTTFREGSKTETLVGIAEDGVHAIGRETPWQPVPEAGAKEWFRRYGLIAALLIVALGGWAWMKQDEIMASFKEAAPGLNQEEGEEGIGEGASGDQTPAG